MYEVRKKLEEDRIGQGVTSKAIGGLGNIVSLGNAGWGIGRPSETDHNTSTPAKGDGQYVDPTLMNNTKLRK